MAPTHQSLSKKVTHRLSDYKSVTHFFLGTLYVKATSWKSSCTLLETKNNEEYIPSMKEELIPLELQDWDIHALRGFSIF